MKQFAIYSVLAVVALLLTGPLHGARREVAQRSVRTENFSMLSRGDKICVVLEMLSSGQSVLTPVRVVPRNDLKSFAFTLTEAGGAPVFNLKHPLVAFRYILYSSDTEPPLLAEAVSGFGPERGLSHTVRYVYALRKIVI